MQVCSDEADLWHALEENFVYKCSEGWGRGLVGAAEGGKKLHGVCSHPHGVGPSWGGGIEGKAGVSPLVTPTSWSWTAEEGVGLGGGPSPSQAVGE